MPGNDPHSLPPEDSPVEEERGKPLEQDEPDDAVDPGSGGGNGD